jgi:hypothetical protein
MLGIYTAVWGQRERILERILQTVTFKQCMHICTDLGQEFEGSATEPSRFPIRTDAGHALGTHVLVRLRMPYSTLAQSTTVIVDLYYKN